jgi:hypothetical protein
VQSNKKSNTEEFPLFLCGVLDISHRLANVYNERFPDKRLRESDTFHHINGKFDRYSNMAFQFFRVPLM